MTEISRAQKARLGLFLVLAFGILAAVIVVKVGSSLSDHRDIYHVRMPGSVGALEPGSAVTFNGIAVGRVARVTIDTRDVAMVAIELSLDEGTPIPEDTVATVAMRGITGLKYVELDHGTQAARRRKPGEEIPAGRSLFDEIQVRAGGIAAKLDGILDDARGLMIGPNRDQIEQTLASVRRSSELLEDLTAAASPRVERILGAAEGAAVELGAVLAEARQTAVILKTAAQGLGKTLESVSATTLRVGSTVERVGGLVERAVGSFERVASEEISPLVVRISRAVTTAEGQLGGALAVLSESLSSIGAAAEVVRSDPGSLVFGRSAPERELR